MSTKNQNPKPSKSPKSGKTVIYGQRAIGSLYSAQELNKKKKHLDSKDKAIQEKYDRLKAQGKL